MEQIYLHGLGQTPASWSPVLRSLAEEKEAACPDLTGLLACQEPTYPNLYSALIRLWEPKPAPVTLCGLSLGGVLALNYAVDFPERVGALVLIAPQYKMPKRLLQAQNFLFRLMPQGMFRDTGFSKDQFLRLCGSMMELDLSKKLPRVRCPVLVICGSRDRANQAACKALAELLPRAELHFVEGAGHEVNRDAPEKLAGLLRDFYRRSGV